MSVSESPAAPAPIPARRGRPTDYDPEFHNERAFRLSLLGMTDAEIAHNFGVAESTLYAWKRDYPEFSEAIESGKEDADGKVADSLYQRARGYSHPAVKIVADAKTGAIVEVPYVEHYPPDTAAAFIWLKNRQSGKWRDRQHVVVEDADKVLARVLGVEPEALPPAESAQVVNEAANEGASAGPTSASIDIRSHAGGTVDLDRRSRRRGDDLACAADLDLDKHQG